MRAASGHRSTTLEMVISGLIEATWGASRAGRDTGGRTSNCTVAIVHRPATQRSRLLIALGLAVAVFAIEAAGSIFANSLALLAEAFHVLIDVVALGIAFVALWLGGEKTRYPRPVEP